MKGNYISKLVWVFITGLLVMSSAQAANEWFTTDVEAIRTRDKGANPPLVLVLLSDAAGSPAFTSKEFRIPNKSRKEMLATLLAAVTNGFQVEVFVDLASANKPKLINLVLLVPAL